jgi:hypothetical protein
MLWFKCGFAEFPDATVIVAWCQDQETDIVKVTNEKDFDDCANLDNWSSDVIMSTPDGHGFVAIQNTENYFGTFYYASRSLCKFGFKVAIKITE